MAAVSKIPRVSFEQFLLLLEMSHTKLEWLDGVAYAMAGGSFEHSRLASRIGTLLTIALRGKLSVVAPKRHAGQGAGRRFRGVP